MHWIVKPVEEKHELGVQRLQELIRATCLRRTKQKTLSSGELSLPPRSERIQEVYLLPDDQVLYDSVKEITASMAAGLNKVPQLDSSPQGKKSNILPLINSLRLICDHKQLVPESIKTIIKESSVGSFDFEVQQIQYNTCSVCGGEIDGTNAVAKAKNHLCANCATSEEGPSKAKLQVDLAHREDISAFQSANLKRSSSAEVVHQPSAKVFALLKNLHRVSSTNGASCKQKKR